ncbi:hypothetical protein P3632_04300 [Vibrio parahaemolyticus]|uniref:Uncharacterized protein n=1 Tax=Vibrio parahaemolyticus TaxID=670 RepID=A0A7Y0SJX8_VIBPH|nr:MULTISPECIES: hypothetical protein [Vibrio]EIU6866082.1 hypothetical protein [Vibrio parahaemolyticus]EIV8508368.1 hypothetical protein [Vibrio parahaemolyticus]EJL6727355.1 hypothetical protein [Vibrio alginolyticus]EJR2788072.1 hypothetical protein [Vibrio parahaemolyticus]ELA6602289.1 hypothetical protein [Vibrio alginolyticus]
MSILTALLLGFIYPLLLKQKLAAGGYGLKITFWIFGLIIGAMIYVGIPVFYFHKINMLQGSYNAGLMDGFSILSQIKVLILCGLFYFHLVYIGIWNSSKESTTWVKILARYFAIPLILAPAFGLIPGRTSLIFEFIIFGIGLYTGQRIINSVRRSKV